MALWRAQLRSTAVSVITAALTGGDATVTSSKDQPVQDPGAANVLQAVLVYVDDRKVFDYGSAPEAKTTATVTIDVDVSGTTKDEAETNLDNVCDVIETALFSGDSDFVKLFEMIDSCDTFTEYKGGEGRKHFAGATIEIRGHTHEKWDATLGPDLKGLNIYVDSVNIYDPNGTFTGLEPFDVAKPAPRTSGPDGRPEIVANIDLDTDDD